jgi:hypothetical protein
MAKQAEVAQPSESFDLFVIHTGADTEAIVALGDALRAKGVHPWVAQEQSRFGAGSKSGALNELERAPAAALIIGSPGLPSRRGQEEVDAVKQRKSRDPAFRFLLVYLPEAHPIANEALPVVPDSVISLARGSEDEGIAQIAAAIQQPSGPEAGQALLSPSVRSATDLPGSVTSVIIVRRLLETHPDYAKKARGSSSPQLHESSNAPSRPVSEWLADVAALYEPGRVPTLHGRLLIDGLARVDETLNRQLRELGLLEELRREITPSPETLLRKRRDGAATLTDHPATVDELGRAVLAKVLSTRIRRVRQDELERHEHDPDPSMRRGGPLLLHVYGRWGAGKTSLLHFLREELEEPPWGTKRRDDRRNIAEAFVQAIRLRTRPDALGGPPGERWIVIDFNAWGHQRTAPPWWWLMAALAHDGGRALWRIDRPRWLRLKAWDIKWRLRGGLPGLLLILAGLVIAWFVWKSGKVSTSTGLWPSMLSATEGVVKALSAILALLLTVWGGAKALNRWLLVGSPRTADAALSHGNDPLEALSLRFAGLVRRLHYPVAIFIDDLDRCQTKYVVELLEGLQTLFRDVPVTYVVAADRDWVCQSFAEEYKSFCNTVGEPGRPLGHLFLEKTFQVSAPIPALSDAIRSTYLQRLLSATTTHGTAALEVARRDAHKRFQGLTSREEIDAELDKTDSVVEQQAAAEAAVLRLAGPELEAETEHMLQPFAPLLEANPRSMKRLVNAYGIASAVEILRSVAAEATQTRPETLALWTILSLRWPLLADYLVDDPELAEKFGDGDSPGDPPWLDALWGNRDVKNVLNGEARNVNARLDADAVVACAGARAVDVPSHVLSGSHVVN